MATKQDKRQVFLMGFVTHSSRSRVRIIKSPAGRELESEGFDVRRFQPGCIYEVGPRLAEYLIVGGYAVLEARQNVRDKAADESY